MSCLKTPKNNIIGQRLTLTFRRRIRLITYKMQMNKYRENKILSKLRGGMRLFDSYHFI